MLIKKIIQVVAFASIMMVDVMDGDDTFARSSVGALNRIPDEFLALPALRIHTASLADTETSPQMQVVMAIENDEQFPDGDLIVEFPYSEIERTAVAERLSYPPSTLRVMSSFLIAQKNSYVVMSNTVVSSEM